MAHLPAPAGLPGRDPRPVRPDRVGVPGGLCVLPAVAVGGASAVPCGVRVWARVHPGRGGRVPKGQLLSCGVLRRPALPPRHLRKHHGPAGSPVQRRVSPEVLLPKYGSCPSRSRRHPSSLPPYSSTLSAHPLPRPHTHTCKPSPLPQLPHSAVRPPDVLTTACLLLSPTPTPPPPLLLLATPFTGGAVSPLGCGPRSQCPPGSWSQHHTPPSSASTAWTGPAFGALGGALALAGILWGLASVLQRRRHRRLVAVRLEDIQFESAQEDQPLAGDVVGCGVWAGLPVVVKLLDGPSKVGAAISSSTAPP